VLTCGLHERRRPRTVRVGNRAPGAKQRYFHCWRLTLIALTLGVAKSRLGISDSASLLLKGNQHIVLIRK
jgi:hypothetical protein